MTPEQCATHTFRSLLERLVHHGKLNYFVVDEAHCVSQVLVFCTVSALYGCTQWGHDFRPDYLKLGQLREMTGAAPWAALTATANTQVLQWDRPTGLYGPVQVVSDIASSLQLRPGYRTFKLPCFRSNIHYDVIFKETLDVSQFSLVYTVN